MVIKMSMDIGEILPVLTEHVRKTVPQTQSIKIKRLEIVDGDLLSVDFDVILGKEKPTQ